MAKLKQKDNLKIKYAHFIYLFLINDMSKKLKDLGNLMYLNKSYAWSLQKSRKTKRDILMSRHAIFALRQTSKNCVDNTLDVSRYYS